MPDTYLKVPFAEKDAAKSLGARWDGKQWFVPEGRELAPFVTWLPEVLHTEGGERALTTPEALSTDLQTASKGIPLSRLLAGVSNAVAQAFKAGVWTTAEVLRASSKDGHVYLELSERDANGLVVAKAQAAIWASTAARIVPEFERATAAELGPGIKLMVRAKPVFKGQYGFSLEIDGIDPAYTLGDLEAKKRDIRARLQREGVFDNNRALPPPWDYRWVLVIAPQGGAGLGDFAKEAGRLERHGVCRAVYAYSRFQGEGAAREVLVTLQAALASWNRDARPDAVAIIRGGGAVNDLAWLNDYDLARLVCDCSVPVLTGIGHERDSTVLDEVAHHKFDTPSKVVTGIEQHVAKRTREAQASMDAVLSRAVRDADRMRSITERLNGEVKAFAVSTVGTARFETVRLMSEARLASVRSVHETRTDVAERFAELRGEATAQVTSARHAVPSLLGDVRTWAFSAVSKARAESAAKFPAILERAAIDADRMGQAADGIFEAVVERSAQTIETATTTAQSLMREIAGQGPEKTLVRGFAMVRAADGRTLTSAAEAVPDAAIQVTFRDGSVGARVAQPERAGHGVADDESNESKGG